LGHIYYWLGENYYMIKDFSNTDKYLNLAIDYFQTQDIKIHATSRLGWVYYEQQEYQKALDYFKQLMGLEHENILCREAQFMSGKCYFDMRIFAESEESFMQFLKDFSRGDFVAESYFWMAEARYNSGKYFGAIKAYRKALGLLKKPDWIAEALYGLGWAYFEVKDFRSSLRYFAEFDRVTKEHIQKDNVKIKIIENLMLLEKYRASEEALKDFLKQPYEVALQNKAMEMLSFVYIERKKYDQAITTLMDLIKKSRDDQVLARAYFGVGLCHKKLKQFDEAIECFEKSQQLAHNPNLQAEAVKRIADVLFEKGLIQESLEKNQWILMHYPDIHWVEDALYGMGLAYVRLSQNERAMDSFETLIESHPKSYLVPYSRLKIGTLLMKNQKWNEAISNYDEIIRSFPNTEFSDASHVQAGLCLLEINDYSKAIEQFKIILQKSKNGSYKRRALYEIAWSYYQGGDFQDAIDAYVQFVQKYSEDPLIPDALFRIAEIRYHLGEFENAKDGFLSLYREYTQYQDADKALFWAGRSYYNLTNYEEARKIFDVYRTRFPNKSTAYESLFYMSDCYFMQKKYDKAIEIYQQLVESAPGGYIFSEVYERWGDCLLLLHAYNEAWRIYDQAIVLGENVRILFKKARAYRLMGNLEDAIDTFLQIVYRYPDQTYWYIKAVFETAECYEDMGQYERAATLYQKVVELNKERVDEAKERIERLEKWLGRSDIQ
ncbi:MAG: tetratricopeptide repeat protein, partial [Chlamydiota bacterium]|nr:tetratricopeptide repeat protein [Chlamydiota bacterium]